MRSHDCFADLLRSLPESSKPVQVPDSLTIARRSKIEAPSEPAIESARNGTTNGISTTDIPTATGLKRKREQAEPPADPPSAQKLRKMGAISSDHGTNGAASVIIEDSSNGAIVIDDD